MKTYAGIVTIILLIFLGYQAI